MKKTFLILILAFSGFNTYAQECGNCKTMPSVSLFDFDVQVPQPELKGEKAEGWLEWQQLFWLAKHANAILYKYNKNCIRFSQPSSNDNDELIIGTTHSNLPSANSDVSQYGNYLITGSVKKNGEGYIMHMELQTSCSRKTVTYTDVFFQLSAESSNTISVASQAAAKFSPLIEKIKKFEQEERSQNQRFAIASVINLIKITPAKTKLIAGQQTEFTLELKDCDGIALAGREILFTESIIGSAKMPGTTGGIVSPAKVITDANGKAKANFKMTAPGGKPAIINAHTVTQTPRSCQSVLFGDAQIDALPAYKVVVHYSKTIFSDLNMNSDEDGVVMKASDQKRDEVAYSFSLLYYPSTDQKDGEQIMMMPQFQDEPEFLNSKGGKSIVLFNEGYSESTIIGTSLELVQSPFGAPNTKGKAEHQRYISTAPLLPAISILFKNKELVFFSADVEFPEPEEGLSPVSSSFSVNDKNPNFPVKPKKVTDPNSVYKWVYEFQYIHDEGSSQEGKVFTYGRKEGEGATVQIWKSF